MTSTTTTPPVERLAADERRPEGRSADAAAMVPASQQTSKDRLLVVVFTIAAFLSSTLLFLVQPLVARLLLPLAGGSASLWNTAMVFFQLTLLAGYAYAHASTRRLGLRVHPLVQIAVMAIPLIALPLAVPDGWVLPSDATPALWVLAVLTVMVGLPFFALATTSPTLQVWFSSTDHHRAADPYFLYAAGNVGSVLALIGYPTIMEPLFSLRTQTRIWAIGYVLFMAACIAAGTLARGRQASLAGVAVETAAEPSAPLSWARRGRWLLWGFTPSALMLGVTLFISTDLASFPLLWVLPLLLYLVTFIIAFGKDSSTRIGRTKLFIFVLAVPVVLTFVLQTQPKFALGILIVHLMWFFAAALLCHSRLAADRPPANQLTEFFLILSIGGALGGIFASLLAPIIFTSVYEYGIAIMLVLLIAIEPKRLDRSALTRRLITAGFVLVAAGAIVAPSLITLMWLGAAVLLFMSHGRLAAAAAMAGLIAVGPTGINDTFQDRSFFGVYTIDETETARNLTSGTTLHGSQQLDPEGAAQATTYYVSEGPVGQVFEAIEPSRVGVIGLGAGSIAAYAEPGDDYTFWEIDRLVVDIAQNPDYFTYLSDSAGTVEVIIDDGRHGVSVSPDTFDLIVVDAFGSDAIPVHLLTVEAFGLYLDKLTPDGTLLVHVSNRHFELESIVAAAAQANGAIAFHQSYRPTSQARQDGATPADWIAISRQQPAWTTDQRFTQLETDRSPWTDDYSDVLSVLRFG